MEFVIFLKAIDNTQENFHEFEGGLQFKIMQFQILPVTVEMILERLYLQPICR